MNVLILELKIYCGPDKFCGRSKFGQYDEVKDRAPYHILAKSKTGEYWLGVCHGLILLKFQAYTRISHLTGTAHHLCEQERCISSLQDIPWKVRREGISNWISNQLCFFY